MNFVMDFLTGRRDKEQVVRRGMPRPGEPLGFFGRLTDEQERAALSYDGDDDAIGDPKDMARILAEAQEKPASA